MMKRSRHEIATIPIKLKELNPDLGLNKRFFWRITEGDQTDQNLGNPNDHLLSDEGTQEVQQSQSGE